MGGEFQGHLKNTRVSQILTQLEDVLPVLGSFGHAKTILNANASRFGQEMRLCLQQ